MFALWEVRTQLHTFKLTSLAFDSKEYFLHRCTTSLNLTFKPTLRTALSRASASKLFGLGNIPDRDPISGESGLCRTKYVLILFSKIRKLTVIDQFDFSDLIGHFDLGVLDGHLIWGI